MEIGSPWGLPVALVLSIALLVWVAYDAQEIVTRIRGRGRTWLLATRGLTALLGLLLLWQPRWLREQLQRGTGTIAVLMDTSRSMSLPGAGGVRSKQAQALLREFQEAIPDASVFEFGASSHAVRARDLLEHYRAEEDETRFLASLKSAVAVAGDELGAIVLVSDGADTGQAPSLAALRALGVRVHAVAVGGRGPARDDAITEVNADTMAFLHQQAEVEVALQRTPPQESTVPVELYKDGRLVTEVVANVDAKGQGRVVVPFDVASLGRAVYTVRIPVADGDAIVENNEQTFLMRVTRDRLRVLLVSGRPGWDSHFLRAFLKSRPSIDLITFFILRTASDMSMASPDELSLIPFPTDELFREHLDSFDLVIFQDFNYGPYQMDRYLPRVRDYVLGGGSFAMIGGDLSFSAGGYARTPIAEILPVELESGGDQTSLETFHPQVVTEMASHPLIELLPSLEENLATWSRLSPMLGANLLGRAKHGASVLLLHPKERLADGTPRPVLVTADSSKGRTMALAVDSSYRWGFSTAGRTGDPSAYERFWDRSLRWLTRDPLLEASHVRSDRERYGPGSKVVINYQARATNYGKVGELPVRVQLLDSDQVVQDVKADVDGDGRGQTTLHAPREPGAYVVRLTVGEDNAAEEAFVVEVGGKELARPFPNPKLLQQIARATGGSFFDGKVGDPQALERSRSSSLGVTQVQPLSHWAVFGLLCVAFLADWVLRRRLGLR